FAILVFAVSVAILCYISFRLAKFSFISETLEKYERVIVPIVFIGLGIYILLENGTIQTLFSMLS
ncbi:cadmium resistance transporter, partial [Listeria innocua]